MLNALTLAIYHNVRSRFLLETQFAIPSHVLQREQCACCNDNHIKIAIDNERTVRGLDDLWQNLLDGIKGGITFILWAAASNEDRAVAAFSPGDRLRSMQGGLDISTIEVIRLLAIRGEHVIAHRVLGRWASLIDEIDIEA